ncbi:MAG TPA: ankyrin repeat domain-containing protein [Chloroflexota bacterium]
MEREMVRRLTDACRAGQPERVAELIAAGADVNTRLGSGPRRDPKPLLWTVRPATWTAGHRGVLELLLDAGADPRGGGPEGGLSPLVAAAEQGHREAVELLLSRGAPVGFYEAAALGDVGRVEAGLAEQPALATAVRPCGVGIHGGPGTALHFAALSKLGRRESVVARRLVAVVDLLVARGAPVGAFAVDGVTAPPPLARAARADNAAVAAALLRLGADPADALVDALANDAESVLELLAPTDLAVDLPGDPKLGNSLLDEMIRWGRLASARWLIGRGAPVGRSDRRGWNALHYACSRGVAPDLVESLLARGAPPDARDAEGRTPLDVARANGRAKLVEVLSG